MPPERRRGPYKRYLKNPDLTVPQRTLWWRRHFQAAVRDDQLDVNDEFENQVHDLDEHEHQEQGNGTDGPDDDSSSASSMSSSSAGEPANDSGEEMEEAFQNNDYLQAIDLSESSDESDSDSEMEDRNHSDSDNESEQSDASNHENIPPVENHNQHHQDAIAPNEDENNEVVRGPPLFQGCPLDRAESDILLMSFVLRWGLEEKGVADLLSLIDSYLPCSVMGSSYLFFKRFPIHDLSNVRYTCSECFAFLPREFEPDVSCENCGSQMVKKTLKKKKELLC
ncbi:serine-aspartate repeat-containing protein C-like [Thrips palmi]|uniref:Serine-aspartate repeat-containing protein C-like n=1 Tax=Thrips palmi TaxID=161013 RepID=A0A6P8YNV6_THRPL|nr:serine-aspartate repeat-containing protein C-like [Thrips palmi]